MSEPSSQAYTYQSQDGSLPCQMPPKRKSPKEDLQRTLIGMVAGLGLAGVFGYVAVRDVWPGLASLSWSQTQGVIKSSKVEYSFTNKGGKDFLINVLYTYTVDGKQYQNDHIRFPETWEPAGGEYEKKQADRYRTGSQHTVFYDPSNPARSCLIKGPSYFFACVFGGLSALGLLMGTGCLLSLLSAWKRAAAG